MRILVTGATGFVGKNLLKILKTGDNEIYAFFRDKEKIYDENKINWINHDFFQENIFPSKVGLLPSDLDMIIHLVQSRKYKNFPEEAIDIYKVNIQSTFELLEYGRKSDINSFIYVSSGAVYSPMPGVELTEESEIKISNFYACSKFISELMIGQYKKYFNTIILRLFFPYGPGQKGMLIPTLIENVKNKNSITVFNTDDGIKINPIYIDDAVKAIIKTFNLKGERTINVAGDEKVSIRDIAKMIGDVVNQKPIFKKDSNPSAVDVIGSIKKMKKILKFTPEINMEVGLTRTIQR